MRGAAGSMIVGTPPSSSVVRHRGASSRVRDHDRRRPRLDEDVIFVAGKERRPGTCPIGAKASVAIAR